MNKINHFKNIIIGLTIVIFILILIFTIDVIKETPNWSFLNIDFKNKNNIISAYGTLVGGILAFLSILFVLYGLLEQRQQILTEKHNEQKENKQELIDKLKLLSSYFKSTISDIITQGETFKEFYLKEKKSPSAMNTMYFTANNNFSRIIDMDPLSIYRAVRTNFFSEPKWEKIFLDIYSTFDFYSEGIKDLRTKYQSQIKFKVKEQRKISKKIGNLLNISSLLVDEYKTNFPNNYMEYDWVILVNEFTANYYKYLKECEKKGVSSNLRTISDKILLPFLNKAMKLRKNIGYITPVSRKLVVKTSNIRKKINEIEHHCLHYAADIEKQYNEYFSIDSKHLKELINLKETIDSKIK